MSSFLLALALTAASQSKLGVVVKGDLGAPTSPAGQIMAACPTVAVFPIRSDSANAATVAQQIASYMGACPSGHAIAQVGDSGLPVNGSTVATLWFTVWLPQLQQINASLLYGVEGPWEPTGTGADVAAFWAQFALTARGSGFFPIVGALAPGAPPGIGTSSNAFCTTIDAIRNVGVQTYAWSVHVRSGAMATTDPAFAFEQIATDCGLSSLPLVMTAALPAGTSWSSTDIDWLIWFDGQLASSGVVGVGAVAIGADAGSFDLSPFATQLIAQLTNPAPPNNNGGGGGGSGSGGVVQNPPPGGTSGELSPPKSGCSTAGPGWLGLLAMPALLLRRRLRRRQGANR